MARKLNLPEAPNACPRFDLRCVLLFGNYLNKFYYYHFIMPIQADFLFLFFLFFFIFLWFFLFMFVLLFFFFFLWFFFFAMFIFLFLLIFFVFLSMFSFGSWFLYKVCD